jgi:hypothetical protein
MQGGSAPPRDCDGLQKSPPECRFWGMGRLRKKFSKIFKKNPKVAENGAVKEGQPVIRTKNLALRPT